MFVFHQHCSVFTSLHIRIPWVLRLPQKNCSQHKAIIAFPDFVAIYTVKTCMTSGGKICHSIEFAQPRLSCLLYGPFWRQMPTSVTQRRLLLKRYCLIVKLSASFENANSVIADSLKFQKILIQFRIINCELNGLNRNTVCFNTRHPRQWPTRNCKASAGLL